MHDARTTRELADAVRNAITGGAALVQYRSKCRDTALQLQQATALQEICRTGDVPLIINDNVELALDVGAAGVHLGREDAQCESVRRQVPPSFIIGVSCYSSIDRARAAVTAGADYVAFGSFFPSPTKPQAPPCPVELLAEARRELHVSVVAIGGITPENGRQLITAGADFLAVITGVFAEDDVCRRARCYQALFIHDEA